VVRRYKPGRGVAPSSGWLPCAYRVSRSAHLRGSGGSGGYCCAGRALGYEYLHR